MLQNDVSVQELVSLILKFFHPKSVVEIGCGEGELLKEFQKNGLRITGTDSGSYANAEFWKKNRNEFHAADITSARFNSKIKLDLAVSLEVANKIPSDHAPVFIHDLCQLSDVILFSSCIPGQDEDSKNPQFPSYWKKLFRNNGFISLDCIRPLMWGNRRVKIEYRQNILVYINERFLYQYPLFYKFYMKENNNGLSDVVHPEYLMRIMGDIHALKKEILKYQPRKILYIYPHPAAFGWIVAHKLTKHKTDDAYLLIGEGEFSIHLASQYESLIKKFVAKNIFKGYFTYNEKVALNCSSVAQGEKEIEKVFDDLFRRQECDVRLFDYVYSTYDVYDPVGIYFSLKKIKFTSFELSSNHFKKRNRNFFIGCLPNRKIYCDMLFKHCAVFGKNKFQSVVLFPSSDKVGFSEKEYTLFDPGKAILMLAYEDKKTIRDVFDIERWNKSKPLTWIFLLSDSKYGEIAYRNFETCNMHFKNSRCYFFFCIQVTCDYFCPENTFPILKLHPRNYYIDENWSKLYSNGISIIHPYFTAPLMNLVPEDYLPEYVILSGNTAESQIEHKFKKIYYEGGVISSLLIHKYYIVLSILKFLGYIDKRTPEKFGSIGAAGKYDGYNAVYMKKDISSLLQIQFPDVAEFCNISYSILQESLAPAEEILSDREFIIYTDPWGKISIEDLKEINAKKCIIKIKKQICKSEEYVIAPRENEYIFFFTKKEKYIEKMRNFSINKKNNAMGIEVSTCMLSEEKYISEQIRKN